VVGDVVTPYSKRCSKKEGHMVKCEKCRAEGASLRCSKCKAVSYCSKGCQRSDWRLHKRACSEDPALRQFVVVEHAIERALTKHAKLRVPAEATCYICLEGDDSLLRGCACRGDYAGWVHEDCLAEMASRSERTADVAGETGYLKCITCKQLFRDALMLRISRRWWRQRRNDVRSFQAATRCLATVLESNGEVDASDTLFEAAAGEDSVVTAKYRKIRSLADSGRKQEALDQFRELLLKENVTPLSSNDTLYYQIHMDILHVLFDLELYDECVDESTKYLAFAATRYGADGGHAQQASKVRAMACGLLGRFDESKAILDRALALETRTLGKDHPRTKETTTNYALHRKRLVLKALDLARQRDFDKAGQFLDAVLPDIFFSEKKKPLDDKDADVDVHYDSLLHALSACTLLKRCALGATIGAHCVAFGRKVYGQAALRTQRAMSSYAVACVYLDRPQEAHGLLTDVLKIQRASLGPDHPETVHTTKLLNDLLLSRVTPPRTSAS